jgi:hypothetical protein
VQRLEKPKIGIADGFRTFIDVFIDFSEMFQLRARHLFARESGLARRQSSAQQQQTGKSKTCHQERSPAPS